MASTHPPYLVRDDSISDRINEAGFITRFHARFLQLALPLPPSPPSAIGDRLERQLGPRFPVSRQFDSFVVFLLFVFVNDAVLVWGYIYIYLQFHVE